MQMYVYHWALNPCQQSLFILLIPHTCYQFYWLHMFQVNNYWWGECVIEYEVTGAKRHNQNLWYACWDIGGWIWQVGVSVVDRFTYYTLQFFENIDIHSNTTLQRLVIIREIREIPISKIIVPCFFSDLWAQCLDY